MTEAQQIIDLVSEEIYQSRKTIPAQKIIDTCDGWVWEKEIMLKNKRR